MRAGVGVGLVALGGVWLGATLVGSGGPAEDPAVDLRAAVVRGDHDALEEALAEGADPDHAVDGATALHVAAGRADAVAAALLIAAGAEVDARRDAGDAPVHVAASVGAVPVLGLLAEAGADLAAATADGLTALAVALEHHQGDAVAWLLARSGRPEEGAGLAPRPWPGFRSRTGRSDAHPTRASSVVTGCPYAGGMSAPEPMSAPAVRWGILGAGGIARKLADAVTRFTASQVVAVGSRDLGKARAFAEEAGIPKAHGSYEDLVADRDVDIVYVATPHSHHHEHALLAIRAGKHVMCEKPLTQNAAQAREVVAAAREAGVFLMEAMWARHLPHMYELRSLIEAGEIGDLVSIQADHGQLLTHVPRMWRPDLAGGALLDLGVYPVSFAHDLLGVPERITASGRMRDTGVDGQVSMVFDYPTAQASLTTTMEARTPNIAHVAGTDGFVVVDRTFYNPTTMTVTRLDGETRTFDGRVDNGFQFEAAEAARRIHAGETESPLHTLEQTIEVVELMDQVREQIGLVYPNEA
ncbi:Gfo/Idh/MocA family protein [Demequina pelophila]|uniref:Gfo/Idh/MocA family protein n=1 Tax=Demequina pelophila TaxID=1638984 RepID=UPI000B13A158|nr:Gfo/Idh/MocA family oxidoreductase [Demequina pelophila]